MTNLQWVKAETRMPDNGEVNKIVPIKPIRQEFDFYMFLKYIRDWDVKDTPTFRWNLWDGYHGWTQKITPDLLPKIEWLSESPSSIEGEEKEVHHVFRGWDSRKLIGRIHERHKELSHKNLDEVGFNHGWLEGRGEMLQEMREEWDESPAPTVETGGWVNLDKFIVWLDATISFYEHGIQDEYGQGCSKVIKMVKEQFLKYQNKQQ